MNDEFVAQASLDHLGILKTTNSTELWRLLSEEFTEQVLPIIIDSDSDVTILFK